MNNMTADPVDQDLSALPARLDAIRSRPSVKTAEERSPAAAVLAEAAGKAKRLYADRRRRTDVFGEHGDLFGEPAWDILLDLFVARSEARSVRVSDSCVAAAVPRTTALRWLQTLTQRGMIERMDDHRDARSSIVQLTARGAELIGRYLARIA